MTPPPLRLLSRTLLSAISTLLLFPSVVVSQTGEPTSHTEVQAQNRYVGKISPEDYARWVAYVNARPSEEQVWLRTLEEQLGSFYGPTYMKQLIHADPKLTPSNDGWAYVKDDPSLPRILIIGDSISRSYTAPLRVALRGKANVHRAPANCGRTDYFFQHGEVWLEQNGSNRWDLVLMNYGVHDYDKPPGQFAENLRKIVARLRQTGARIVWVRTVPWGRATDDASVDRSPKTNETSDAVARAEGLAVIDLHSPMLAERGRLQTKDHTHWREEGAQLMGDLIARAVEQNLQRGL